MEGKSTRVGWSFWLLWVLASTVGGIAGNSIATSSAKSWAVAGTLIGAGTGIMQWLLLQREIPRAAWWIPASAVGGALGLSAGMGLSERGVFVCGSLSGGVWIGILTGIPQWFILGRRVSQSGWWVLASILAWGVGWNVGFAIAPGTAAGAGMTFAITGAVTGLALIWLLSHQELQRGRDGG
ncbi:MAG: hypothetical protein AB8I69_21420 [Anaerolineae bacterium]|jgi:hypothetical protein